MRKFLIIFALILGFISPSYGQGAKANMDDALGRAYKASSEKKTEEAKQWFQKGLQYAKEANSWQGIVDSGYGLSTLGLPEEAKAAFFSASQIVLTAKDWHAAVALGYAFASLPHSINNLHDGAAKSLPKESGTTESAIEMWTNAKDWADKTNDWRGLLEAGRGFMSITKNDKAEECIDMANRLVKDSATEESVKALVQAYRKLGREDKAIECAKYNIVKTKSPPPGWVPTAGETVRGPKTVAPEIQQAQRASIDMDLESKRQWEMDQARMEQEQEMQKRELAYAAYRDSLMYYSYPYYGSYTGIITNYDDYYAYGWTNQPMWAVRTNDEIYNWGLWNLGRYTCVDGIYISVDID